ncbi:hypothetical protein HKD37_01G001260 [Glycine soja]
MTGHDWPRILFPTYRYIGTDRVGLGSRPTDRCPFPALNKQRTSLQGSPQPGAIEQPKAYAANIYNRPPQPQQQNQPQQSNYDLSSNRYNPGWRNHPNLRWSSPQQQQQQPAPSFQNAAGPSRPYIPPPIQQQQQPQKQPTVEAPPQPSLEELFSLHQYPKFVNINQCTLRVRLIASEPNLRSCLMDEGLTGEMASRKLASKRSRKDKAAEGTSSAPEYDSHRFRSAEHQQRFEAIKGWSFLRERRVQLRDDEYTDFQEEIGRRRWASLVTPMAKFDPEIVLEFYVNAWPTEEGVRDMRSWVRGQWIPFDAEAIGQLLGYPLVLEEGQECEYGQRRNRSDGFDGEAIAQLLCIPGQDFTRTAAGRRVRIMRTNMTTLTQIWMTLLLSNILPIDHNSDLPLPKCQLVYAILTRMSIHVAQLIADAIYIFAGMAPTRHPLDQDKSNRALGFPALITGLCQSFRVPVTPSKVIRPPITRAFIEKYCTQRQVQGDAPQAADAPPPYQAGPAGSFDTEQYLRHLVRQQAANHRAHFRAEVAWPGDWPEAQAGEAPAEAPDEADEAHEDEEMIDLLYFLGGSGAT